MEKMIDLKDLLTHEIIDLLSAEDQIIEALPAMIDKAKNPNLKKALKEHLKITEEQRKRLDQVKQLMSDESNGRESEAPEEEKKGFFSRLFTGSNEMEKCKGMEGLIDEGEKIMGEDMSPEVLDAAIIASAQKIEHYEISGYGTARAYAKELRLREVEKLLEKTLQEEYEADDLLTQLAVKRLNLEAEKANSANNADGRSGGQSAETESRSRNNGRSNERSKANKSSDEKKKSAKANTSKDASSRQKSNSRSSNIKNKKSAPKRPQAKSKKATGSKRKASAR